MNSFQRNVIALIKNAISFEKTELEEQIDWGKVVALSKSHYIIPLVYCAIKKLKLSVPKEFLDEMELATMSYAIIEGSQLYELSRIEEAFQKEGIEYMPLKGINSKNLYPDNVTRRMKDLDILIKVKQYGEIATIMGELGFSGGNETYHEFVWKKGKVIVELHKTIESPYHKNYYAYFKDGWDFAVKEEEKSTKHIMKNEDEFSYLFTHFAGHYRTGGIGILHFVDLWLFLQKHPDMDEKYLRNALSKLGLLKFYENVILTLNAWFESGAEDETTKLITNKIFTRGNTDKSSQSRANRNAKNLKQSRIFKIKSIVRALFPSFLFMKTRNPILKKAPMLLPVVWAIRWFDILIFKKDKIAKRISQLKSQTTENISGQINELNAVGLDFKE